jgi:predicted deacylase
MSDFEIGGFAVPPGARREIRLKISESYHGAPVHIPVMVIRGREDGPRLFLTAAIHGDEINGTQVIRRLLFGRDWADLRGTLVCAPVVNIFGFFTHSRYLPDRRDLNRSFPGSPAGSHAGRIAHRIFNEIVAKCDFGVDFHTAAVRRTNFPHVRADWKSPGVRKLARAFGAGVILDRGGEPTTLRSAASAAGVPTIVYEAGETFKFQRSAVRSGVSGTLNLLARLKMIDHTPSDPGFELLIRDTTWVRADRGGILAMRARPGAVVEAGRILAVNTSPFGRERNNIRAPFAGIVLGTTTWPSLNPGDPVVHLGKVKESELPEIRRLITETRAGRAG